jgi:GDP-mannose 6-dehydrogenase
MKISVMGLGYVGAVSAGCFTNDGHFVIGVDTNNIKVDLISQGKSPIIEEGLEELIRDSVENGLLEATNDLEDAVMRTEMSLVCVGTPSQSNGSLDLRYIRRVCEQIGLAIKEKREFHVVIIRSTMLPGTMKNVVIKTLEESSGLSAGVDFGVCINPEFLREGSAVYDFYNPPKTVIGQIDNRSGDIVSKLYEKIDAPLIKTDLPTAEMVKYTDNVWHALKVGFANEIGNIAKAVGVDSHKVMDIFCKDQKLNLSAYYLKPGFAFGGSCLPKDVRALTYKAKALDLDLPILSSILTSNNQQIERGFDMIMSMGKKRVGILGFSFKAGTDDLRESPMVNVIERLLGKGIELQIYDKNVSLAAITGANKNYILDHIPHISRLMVDSIDDILANNEVIVIGNKDKDFAQVIEKIRDDQSLIDFVRITNSFAGKKNYEGVSW